MRKLIYPVLVALCALTANSAEPVVKKGQVVLFEDGFGQLRSGSLGSVIGAQGEYHYMKETGPKGNWYISSFINSSQLAWKAGNHNDKPALFQTYVNKSVHTRPTLSGGDDLWRDYTVTAHFAPEEGKGRTGIEFRHRNDRCYYFFGLEGSNAVLKMVKNETGFREPYERVLANKKFAWKSGDEMVAEVTVIGNKIKAVLNGKLELTVEDDTFANGRVALTSDFPTRFTKVEVTASKAEAERVAAARAAIVKGEKEREAANPKMVLWKKFKTDGYGVGRNLRFGDLNGDGKIDILFGQMVHRGPKDSNSELSCLMAADLDGELLWQIGEPDAWRDRLTNDVGFQIHDIDGDGQNRSHLLHEHGTHRGRWKNRQNEVQSCDTGQSPVEPPPFNKFPKFSVTPSISRTSVDRDVRATSSLRTVIKISGYSTKSWNCNGPDNATPDTIHSPTIWIRTARTNCSLAILRTITMERKCGLSRMNLPTTPIA